MPTVSRCTQLNQQHDVPQPVDQLAGLQADDFWQYALFAAVACTVRHGMGSARSVSTRFPALAI